MSPKERETDSTLALLQVGTRFSDALNALNEAIFILDTNGVVVFCNSAAQSTFGWSDGFPTTLELIHPESLAVFSARLAITTESPATQAPHGYWDITGVKSLTKEPFPIEASLTPFQFGDQRHVILAIRDISERREAEKEIRYLAEHDTLTGLRNRARFYVDIERHMKSGGDRGYLAAVMFLDLDRFKFVNDTLGHEYGDALLREVADRLRGCVRKNDVVARIGGDEFAILQTKITHVDMAAALASRVITELSSPFLIDGEVIQISTSIGIAIYPFHDDSPELLVKNADIAMYHAKELGSGRYEFFSDVMRERIILRKNVETALRTAINKGELQLYFQPCVDLYTGKITGLEALARWMHPELGIIFPPQFMVVAEDTGLALNIDDWVVKALVAQVNEWVHLGIKPPRIAMNISSNQARRHNFSDVLLTVLAEAKVPLSTFEVEVTEKLFSGSVRKVNENVGRLHCAGVQVAIDGFGLGLSSLTQLRKLSLDRIKLDRSYIYHLDTKEGDCDFVEGVIQLCRRLNLHVTANGVERETQARILASMGCREAQGFLFCEPQPSEKMSQILLSSGKLYTPQRMTE